MTFERSSYSRREPSFNTMLAKTTPLAALVGVVVGSWVTLGMLGLASPAQAVGWGLLTVVLTTLMSLGLVLVIVGIVSRYR